MNGLAENGGQISGRFCFRSENRENLASRDVGACRCGPSEGRFSGGSTRCKLFGAVKAMTPPSGRANSVTPALAAKWLSTKFRPLETHTM